MAVGVVAYVSRQSASGDGRSVASTAIRAARRSWKHTLLRIGDAPSDTQQRYDKVETELDVLAQRLQAGEMTEEEVVLAADALGRMRVYVFPPQHLRDLSDGILHDLTEWRVPEEALAGLRLSAQRAHGQDLAAARSSVEDMLLDRDYWDRETDNWHAALGRAAGVGIPLVVAAVFASFFAFAYGLVIFGFVLAGAAGSGTSVLLRLPGPSVYGKVSDFWVRAWTRCLAGTVAAAMGLGLLLTGILNVPLAGSQTIIGVVTSCSHACPVEQRSILFCVAVAFGFSERLLASLSNSILGPVAQGGQERSVEPSGQAAPRAS